MSDESYVRETKIKLIEKAKNLVDQCLEIVGQSIDEDIKDDKMLNVLKAKDQAMTMAVTAAERVETLQLELDGKTKKVEKTVPKNMAERHAE